MKNLKSAYISEIYSSVQGEGPYTGEAHVFVRFAGCPLRCVYCDTPDSLVAQGHAKQDVAEVAGKAVALARQKKIRTVSLTGGEPLVYAAFLKELMPMLKKRGLRVYLETAGIHSKNLADVIRFCDVVAMDIKLPSAVGKPYWKEHREFIRVGRKKIFSKIVLEKRTPMRDVRQAVTLLKTVSKKTLFIIQPASSIPPVTEAPLPDQIQRAYAYASANLPHVLVMPQQHKMWGAR